MASFSKTALIFALVIALFFYVPSLEGRKILSMKKMKSTVSLEEPFHCKLATNKKLSGLNIAKDVAVLQYSVPSPGTGN